VRLALECRRRVKEQQKRIGAMEFRNTHFSYTMGEEGVEQFVTTPELQSPDEIGSDPLPPGQVWALSPGAEGENPGLLPGGRDGWARNGRQDPKSTGAGPVPREHSVGGAEPASSGSRNSLATASRDKHEFNVQLHAQDAARSGASLGLPVLLALASGLVEKSLKGGLIAVGWADVGAAAWRRFRTPWRWLKWPLRRAPPRSWCPFPPAVS